MPSLHSSTQNTLHLSARLRYQDVSALHSSSGTKWQCPSFNMYSSLGPMPSTLPSTFFCSSTQKILKFSCRISAAISDPCCRTFSPIRSMTAFQCSPRSRKFHSVTASFPLRGKRCRSWRRIHGMSALMSPIIGCNACCSVCIRQLLASPLAQPLMNFFSSMVTNVCDSCWEIVTTARLKISGAARPSVAASRFSGLSRPRYGHVRFVVQHPGLSQEWQFDCCWLVMHAREFRSTAL